MRFTAFILSTVNFCPNQAVWKCDCFSLTVLVKVQLSNVQEILSLIFTEHFHLSVSCQKKKTMTLRDLKKGDDLNNQFFLDNSLKVYLSVFTFFVSFVVTSDRHRKQLKIIHVFYLFYMEWVYKYTILYMLTTQC